MVKGDPLEVMHYRFDPFDITRKVYGAWWQFLREIGIDTKTMLNADYTPVHFIVGNANGESHQQGHMPIDRFTGVGKESEVWYEAKWSGIFNLEVRFENKPGLSQFVQGFLRMMSDGFMSVGRAKVEIEEILNLPKRTARCTHGHFASKEAAVHGDTCKCGAKINGWTQVPKFWNQF